MILGLLGCSEVGAVECAVPRTPTFKSPQQVVQPYPFLQILKFRRGHAKKYRESADPHPDPHRTRPG